MWLAAHAATGAAIQRGTPAWVWIPAAALSHPVLDRVLADYPEQPWEYALNAIALLILGIVSRRYWKGAALAAVPDIEPLLHRLGFMSGQPLHDLWWANNWLLSSSGVASVEAALVCLVIVSIAWGNADALRLLRARKNTEATHDTADG